MRATAFKLIEAAQAFPLPRRIASEPQHIHDARVAAVKRLGTSWVAHPAYVFNPRHSTNRDVYEAARVPYLSEVSRRAAADRARRDAFKRAQAVRAALGGV